MDFHVEQLVVRKKTTADYLKLLGICALTAILWMLIFTFLIGLGIFAAALVVLVGWGALRCIQAVSIEYEYEMTNYYLDIDKIMGRARRKRVVAVDLHNAEICAYVTDSAFSTAHGIDKIYDVSGNPNAEGRAFIDFIGESGKKERVIFKPCDKLKECIKKAAPKVTKL